MESNGGVYGSPQGEPGLEIHREALVSVKALLDIYSY